MAKFELAEFKKVHEELCESLERMKTQNSQLVEPVLNGLREEVSLRGVCLSCVDADCTLPVCLSVCVGWVGYRLHR